jgi:hypothetical protein
MKCRQAKEHLCCKTTNVNPVTKSPTSNGLTVGVIAASEVCKQRYLANKSYSNLMGNLKRRFVKPVTKRSGTTLY